MRPFRPAPLLLLVLGALLVAPHPARAGKIDRKVPFVLDQWVELGVTDGPVTIHRVRVERQSGSVTKSSFLRPGNTEYLSTVRIVVEYSHDGTKDWDADLDIAWLDGAGEVIDGYRDEENLDRASRRETATVTLSTLQYGLSRAKSLRIGIEFHPE